jgi:hypothetical protein
MVCHADLPLRRLLGANGPLLASAGGSRGDRAPAVRRTFLDPVGDHKPTDASGNQHACKRVSADLSSNCLRDVRPTAIAAPLGKELIEQFRGRNLVLEILDQVGQVVACSLGSEH